MATGLSLQLHLLSEEHPEKHDSEHCSLCQQLLIAFGKFMAEPPSILPEFNPQENNVEFQSQSCIITFHFEPFGPRPPPQLLIS
jgi:hypothetical protein